MMFSKFHLRALATVALVISAFHSGNAMALPDGQVLISVTHNSPRIWMFERLTVVRMPGGSQGPGTPVDLPRQLGGVSTDTQVYRRALPAGEYEISALRQPGVGLALSLSEGARKLLGRFSVADGQSVDLGRLVVTTVNNQYLVGRSRRETSNQALVQQHLPQAWSAFQAASQGQPAPRGWLTEPSPDDTIEAYALAHLTGFRRPTEAADGRVLAASTLGSVLVRSRAGTWTTLRSPRMETLLHALPVNSPDAPDTAMVAVGELGLMLRQQVGSTELQVVNPGNLPLGNLLLVAGCPRTGWYVVVQQGWQHRLMRSAQLEGGDWRLVREVEAKAAPANSATQAWWWPTAQGVAVATTKGPIAHLDFATQTWTEHRTPLGHPLLALEPGPAGRLTAMTLSSGTAGGELMNAFRSADGGATWERLPTLPTPTPTATSAPQNLVDIAERTLPRQLAEGTLVLGMGDVQNPELKASTDGGATWQPRKLQRADSRLHALPSGLLLGQGTERWLDVDTSRDGGLSWKRELSSFDLAASQAQTAQQAQPRKP